MLREDPTVRRLESMLADLLGKEAAVFTCSGTQSNQIALRVHCQPGDELLINSTGHIANFEAGAPAALSGITVRSLIAPDGLLDVSDLHDRILADDQHYGRTRLVCLENTTNMGGGHVYPLEQMQRVAEWAWSNKLRMHLDGARLFNAAVAGNYTLHDVGQCFDTVSICFSKGLACPMGSLLAGTADDIRQARRVRKLFGGAMRQTGIVAAAAIYALEHHVDRLQEDHDNARQLAQLLADIDGICISPDDVVTNLLYFEIEKGRGTAVQLNNALAIHGVRMCPFGGQRMRAVTHLDISADDILTAAAVVKDEMAAGIEHRRSIGAGPYRK